MDRLFCMLLLCIMLTPAPRLDPAQEKTMAQSVLFSMLFPQLMPRNLPFSEESEGIML